MKLLNKNMRMIVSICLFISIVFGFVATSRAELVGVYYDVSPGEATFGHNFDALPDWTADFSDSYAYFGGIFRHANNGNLYVPANTAEPDAGWIVFKYKADSANTTTNVVLTLRMSNFYKWIQEIKAYWTTNSYDGLVVPNETQWTDVGMVVWPEHSIEDIQSFQPDSDEFFVAYKIWNTTADYWRIGIGGDKAVVTTVAPAGTLIIIK